MPKSTCPLCNRRRARRSCPALGKQICAVCCGTKRQVEITCPSDCSYLQSSTVHPPAVIQRRQERDLRFLLPTLQGLTESQHQILFMVQSFLRIDRNDAPALTDTDVQQAASALAQTYETASRGIVYEHSPPGVTGQRLAKEIGDFIEAKRSEGARLSDIDLAVSMRRLETAAQNAKAALGNHDDPDNISDTSYLSLLRRVLKDPGSDGSTEKADTPRTTGSRLIVPGR